ncbi:DNA-binding protein [Bacillus cereus]|nr:DNA-binding protein [Bacillus cereus]MBL3768691.1 DNA-binding protein [Bacillus cereus]MBL3881156.1 DNA-binding protein [Bacillus cereus]
MADLLPTEIDTTKEIDKYMTVPEAAERFNIPVETIKSRLKPSIKNFKEQLVPMIQEGLIKSYLKKDGKRKEWIISEDAMKKWFFSEKG